MTDFCQVAGNVTLFNKIAQTVSIAKTDLREGFKKNQITYYLLVTVTFLGVFFMILLLKATLLPPGFTSFNLTFNN